jgi:hypothetical protein
MIDKIPPQLKTFCAESSTTAIQRLEKDYNDWLNRHYGFGTILDTKVVATATIVVIMVFYAE